MQSNYFNDDSGNILRQIFHSRRIMLCNSASETADVAILNSCFSLAGNTSSRSPPVCPMTACLVNFEVEVKKSSHRIILVYRTQIFYKMGPPELSGTTTSLTIISSKLQTTILPYIKVQIQTRPRDLKTIQHKFKMLAKNILAILTAVGAAAATPVAGAPKQGGGQGGGSTCTSSQTLSCCNSFTQILTELIGIGCVPGKATPGAHRSPLIDPKLMWNSAEHCRLRPKRCLLRAKRKQWTCKCPSKHIHHRTGRVRP